MDASDDAYTSLAAKLLNTQGSVPLHERFRALFTLKSLKTPRAIEIISEGELRRIVCCTISGRLMRQLVGFKDESALLKHELAYCLGQIGDEKALPVLQNVLGDMKEDPMVRHEVRTQPFATVSKAHLVTSISGLWYNVLLGCRSYGRPLIRLLTTCATEVPRRLEQVCTGDVRDCLGADRMGPDRGRPTASCATEN